MELNQTVELKALLCYMSCNYEQIVYTHCLDKKLPLYANIPGTYEYSTVRRHYSDHVSCSN